jgi:DNA modification methylase
MNCIEFGDCRDIMKRWAGKTVKAQMCVTSPPYFGLRDYGHDGQVGLEKTPEQYITAMAEVFRCVRDVLADDGTLWLNIGDSYAGAGYSNHKCTGGTKREDGGKQRHPSDTGYKNKDLIGIPWMLAFALRADGWYLRQDIIWHKPNPMPESVRDRCTKAHEYIFLLSKSDRYFFDSEAMKEPATHAGKRVSLGEKSFSKGQAKGAGVAASGNGLADYYDVPATRNRRSVWTVSTRPYKGAHFATFPPALIEPCILAGSRPGDIVLDPFMGSGTTAQVALQHGRQYIGCELNPEYASLQQERIAPAVSEKNLNYDLFDGFLNQCV